MNLQKTGLFILAAAAAVMLAASAIDAEAIGAMASPTPHERPRDNAATPGANPVHYNHPAFAPADANWGSVFGANWR